MKHLIIGSIFLLVGLSMFTPVDELLFLLPLSTIFGIWIIPAWWAIALISLGIGVYLVGISKRIPNPIAKNIWFIITIGIMICVYFAYVWSR